MGGGLMQLVAYGAQDIYLTGNPQITFFKVVYRRHTNFSMETIEQTLNGASSLVHTSTANSTVTISRNGDLLGPVYVSLDQDTNDNIRADMVVSEAKLEIGGQEIDKQTQEWMQLWSELTVPECKAAGYRYMTGGVTNSLNTTGGTAQSMVQVPLQFWFCRNPGLYLPLIALQYHEVKIKFTWASGNSVARDDAFGTLPSPKVWADYVYLDTDERRRFAQVSHEYLIEQVQTQSEKTTSASYKLNFNHPVKALYWTDDSAMGDVKTKVTLNGHDRFTEQYKEFFQLRQPYQHHTAVPGKNVRETDRPQMSTVSAQLEFSHAFTDEESPSANTLIDGDSKNNDGVTVEGDFAIDSKATIEKLNGVDEDGLGAHLAVYSESAPGIKVGDVLLLTVYPDAVTAGTLLTETVTVSAVNATITNRYAYLFTSDLEVIGNSIGGTGNLTIALLARAQDPKPRVTSLDNTINMYSFALKPEEHQPSGTCNFSRIDTAYLKLSSAATVQNVYALNYNVLRIMSGMGGLAYSN